MVAFNSRRLLLNDLVANSNALRTGDAIASARVPLPSFCVCGLCRECLQTRNEVAVKKGGIVKAKQDQLGTFAWIPITYPLSSEVLLTHMRSSLFMTTEK